MIHEDKDEDYWVYYLSFRKYEEYDWEEEDEYEGVCEEGTREGEEGFHPGEHLQAKN